MTGVRPLQVSAEQFIAASFRLPATPGGRTVLTFDLGEGHATVHASSPAATAAWLEQFAHEIRVADAATNPLRTLPKAA